MVIGAMRSAFSTWTNKAWFLEARTLKHQLKRLETQAFSVTNPTWHHFKSSWDVIDKRIEHLKNTQIYPGSYPDSDPEYQQEVIKELRRNAVRIEGIAANICWRKVEK